MSDGFRNNGKERIESEQKTTNSEVNYAIEPEDEDGSKDDPDPQDAEEYHYNSGENTFHFLEAAEVASKHLKPSGLQLNATPPFNNIPTREEHNKQQQEIWRTLRAEVAEDESIPLALFDPPRTFVQVLIAEWPRKEHFCCPCDLYPESLQKIVIRAEKGSKYGITKNMVLERISQELYGDENGVGWTLGDMRSRPVIDHFTWMNSGGLMGHIYAMTKGWIE